MAYTVDYVAPIALSGTKDIIIPVPAGMSSTSDLRIQIDALYAAVAGTTGLTASFHYSPDNATYTASAVPAIKIVPTATVQGTASVIMGIGDIVLRKDPGPINYIKVTLTNLDGTNAATVVVSHSSN